MRAAALLLLAGCSQIFGLHAPDHGTVIDGSSDAPHDGPLSGACITQADCPTSACLPDGSCAADGDVAWLDPNGGLLGASCTMAQPCARISDALQTNRPYWRVHGTITQLTSISQDVTIFGEPGAGIGAPGMSLSMSANVTVRDLTFPGTCLSVGSGTSLTLFDVTIDGCNGYGVQSNGGALTIDRSTIHNNRNGGILIQGNSAQFAITNTFVIGNGLQNQTQYGGIGITAFMVAATSKLEFNTIADNGAKTGSTTSAGIVCSDLSFDARANLIAHNSLQGDYTASNANFSGACQHTGSILQADFTGLALVAPMAGDYHLGTGSTAVDAMNLGTTIDHDVDGESRPSGGGYDVGADELH